MKRITVTNKSGALVARFDLEDGDAERQLTALGAPDSAFKKYGEVSVTVADIEPSAHDLVAACRALRHANYPSIGDQLDALYKARHGDPGPLEEVDAKIAEVKARYPKPGECSC
mgnify:CR=1 FL=1